MATNLENLQTALIEAAGKIVDDIDRLDCLAALDDWYACRLATAALQSSKVLSYSIAGRTVTRQQLPQIQNQERALWLRIMELLYGNGGAADLRNSYIDLTA